MNTLRPLRPREPGDDTPSGSNNNTPPQDTVTKRKRVGAAACRACRKRKSKCDGGRPSCARCADSSVECSYDAQPGQTRLQAIESKNGKLERLFDRLKTAPQNEIEVLLSRIRDGTALNESGDSSGLDPRNEESPEAEGESSARGAGFLSGATLSPYQADTMMSAPSENAIVRPLLREDATDPRIFNMSPVGRGFTKVAVSEDVYNTLVPLRSLERTSPADATLRAHLTDILGYAAMPNALVTKTCVAEFFRCSGKIFHVFPPAEVYEAVEVIFSSSPAVKDKMQMSLVSIVAAIGTFYMPGTDTFYPQLGELYYRIAKTFLDEIVAKESRESVKICALLCLYNILQQNISCLAFAELALVLGKQQGLQAKHKPSSMDAEAWIEARRIWRLLAFMQSWMSVTLDYTSAPWSTEDIATLDIIEETEIEDLAQCELAKIAVLKARMVYNLGLFRELTLVGVTGMMADLREWYGNLPTQMTLEYVDSEVLSPRLQIVVQYVQLMYLNAIMLVNRAVITQQFRTTELEERSVLGMSGEDTARFIDEGIAAATSSALILSQMHTPDTVFKHCWIAIFQSYISATLLLYAVVRAKIDNTTESSSSSSSSSSAYLHAAEQCLHTLRFCASTDSVAARFLGSMEGHYWYLCDVDGGRSGNAATDSNVAVMPSSLEESAAMLLQMLCHPLRSTQNMSMTTSTGSNNNNNNNNTTTNNKPDSTTTTQHPQQLQEQEEYTNPLIRTITDQNLKSTYPDDTAIARLVERLDVAYEERLVRVGVGKARGRGRESIGEVDLMLGGGGGAGGSMGESGGRTMRQGRWGA